MLHDKAASTSVSHWKNNRHKRWRARHPWKVTVIWAKRDFEVARVRELFLCNLYSSTFQKCFNVLDLVKAKFIPVSPQNCSRSWWRPVYRYHYLFAGQIEDLLKLLLSLHCTCGLKYHETKIWSRKSSWTHGYEGLPDGVMTTRCQNTAQQLKQDLVFQECNRMLVFIGLAIAVPDQMTLNCNVVKGQDSRFSCLSTT